MSTEDRSGVGGSSDGQDEQSRIILPPETGEQQAERPLLLLLLKSPIPLRNSRKNFLPKPEVWRTYFYYRAFPHSRHFFFIGRTMVPANIQELLAQACFAPCRSTLRLTRTYHKSCHVVCFAPADSVAPHPPHTPGNPLLCLRCSAPLRRMYLPAGSLSWCAPVPVCHRSAATTCRCVLLFSRV